MRSRYGAKSGANPNAFCLFLRIPFQIDQPDSAALKRAPSLDLSHYFPLFPAYPECQISRYLTQTARPDTPHGRWPIPAQVRLRRPGGTRRLRYRPHRHLKMQRSSQPRNGALRPAGNTLRPRIPARYGRRAVPAVIQRGAPDGP